MKKHEIVGKDWAVVDVVTQFCRKFHLDYGQGLNTEYWGKNEINEESVMAYVEVISWPKGSFLKVALWKNPELKLWQARGTLAVYYDADVITCGFTGWNAIFEVTPCLGEYKFNAVSGYDGQCHCPNHY